MRHGSLLTVTSRTWDAETLILQIFLPQVCQFDLLGRIVRSTPYILQDLFKSLITVCRTKVLRTEYKEQYLQDTGGSTGPYQCQDEKEERLNK